MQHGNDSVMIVHQEALNTVWSGIIEHMHKLLLPLLNFLGPKLFDSNSTITVLE